jgi:hypothetical protein
MLPLPKIPFGDNIVLWLKDEDLPRELPSKVTETWCPHRKLWCVSCENPEDNRNFLNRYADKDQSDD